VRTEKQFANYLHDAINNNYLVTILITSQTQAKIKSQNLPFGLGKTTLALWLSYYLNGENWDNVFQTLCGNPYDLITHLEPGEKRKNACVWDAVQMTAPAEQGVPRVIRRLASYLSDTRPEIACLIMTGTNINAICAPLRKLIVFEVIVPARGKYDIQKITYHKNFAQPLIDLSRLKYFEHGDFPKLPNDVYERYEKWRVSNKLKLYPALKDELQSYIKQHEEKVLESNTFEGNVIKEGGHYVIRLPESIGKEYHRKKLEIMLNPPATTS